jgi:outer membrane murein-binding lipoprotein Lpp
MKKFSVLLLAALILLTGCKSNQVDQTAACDELATQMLQLEADITKPINYDAFTDKSKLANPRIERRAGKINPFDSKLNLEDPCTPLHLTIYESEMRVMAGIGAIWGVHELEAGAEAYGLWSRGDCPMLFLVTGPSLNPKAFHERAFLEQNIEFYQRNNDIFAQKYGIQLIATHHCHHFLPYPGPSKGDESQVQRLTTNNNIKRWYEFIATCEKGDDPANPQAMDSDADLYIRVNAYFYTDPQQGKKVKVPIRVLPGVSPFRIRALADGFVSPADIAHYAAGFPMDHIRYDRLDYQKSGVK